MQFLMYLRFVCILFKFLHICLYFPRISLHYQLFGARRGKSSSAQHCQPVIGRGMAHGIRSPQGAYHVAVIGCMVRSPDPDQLLSITFTVQLAGIRVWRLGWRRSLAGVSARWLGRAALPNQRENPRWALQMNMEGANGRIAA